MSAFVSTPLDWEGCFNVRHLGGGVVRADAIDGLTARGWDALLDYGVRTIIDLRNAVEYATDAVPRPAEVTTVRLPLDNLDDREFWNVWENGPQFGTPLYYRPHLERFPERSAAVVKEIAHAAPGGVVFHCAGGRDRTGQIAMLVLALAGVAAPDIAADYALSFDRVAAKYAARGEKDPGLDIRNFLAERNLTAEQVIVELLADFDVEAALVKGGATKDDFAALRARLGR